MRYVVLVWLLLVGFGAHASAGEDAAGGAVLRDGVLEDMAYRFRLRAPGPGWRVLERDEIRGAVPDALAGVTNGRIWGAVIAEDIGDMDAADYAQLIIDNMGLDDLRIERQAPLVVHGKPGYQCVVTGAISGVRVRYVNTMYRNGSFWFQVIAWTAADQPEGFHQPIVDALSVMPGEVVGRRDVHVVADTDGVGWRVRNGSFVSAALGIRVDPAPGWRVAVGGELAGMGDDAEVGLVHAMPDVYMLLTPDRHVDADREALVVERMHEVDDEHLPEFQGDPRIVVHAGQAVLLQTYRLVSEPHFEYVKGFLFHGDHVLELLFWYARPARTKALGLLEAAVRSIRLLTPEETAAEDASMRLLADPQNAVGAGYALRRGIYRDFEQGFSLKKPAGVHWRAEVGSAAAERAENGVLHLYAPALDVRCMIMVEPAADYTDASLHAAWLEGMFGEDAEATRRGGEVVTWQGAPARLTEDDDPDPDADVRMRLLTSLRAGRAYQVYAWGKRRNMRDARAALDAVVAGMAFPPDLRAEVKRMSGIEDLRFGMVVKPGALWRYTNASPPELRALGVVHTWQQRNTAIMAVAVCAMEEGQDVDWFGRLVMSLLESALGTSFKGEASATRAAGELGGLPCERLTWAADGGANEVFFAARDRTFYMLAVFGKDGVEAAEVERIRSTFRYLD